MATGQCNARQIQLADPATRQGTGLNACGGQGTKGTKLCDRNLERGDGSKVSLLHEDAAVKGNLCPDGTVFVCVDCATRYDRGPNSAITRRDSNNRCPPFWRTPKEEWCR